MILPNFKIGVILGKNNVGKTTILEAIAMLDNNIDKIRNTRVEYQIGSQSQSYF